MRKEGEKEERRARVEKGVRLFLHENLLLLLSSLFLRTAKVSRSSLHFHVGVAAEKP
jgi:hypothetical protein